MFAGEPSAERAFVADVSYPVRRRLYIWHDGVAVSSFGHADWLGWRFAASEISPDGEEQPLEDRWELTFLEIMRYPKGHCSAPMSWRWRTTGDPADLRCLQPKYDASWRHERAVRVTYNSERTERLCFNLYDDGFYRFMLEREIREDGLCAWVPGEWSQPHQDLAATEADARKRVSWANSADAGHSSSDT